MNLTSVTLPDSLTKIGPRAFQDCTALESLILPDNISTISAKTPFAHTTTLYCRRGSTTADRLEANMRFHLYLDSDPENPLTIANGVVLDCDPAAVSVIVPEGVTCIGEKAFFLCGLLTSVTLPDSLEDIDESAFLACSSLTDINLPQGLTIIRPNTFEFCKSLTSITIPDGVVFIDNYAFNECYSLKNVHLPDSVVHIGEGAFRYGAFETFDLPPSLTSISRQLFMFCENLTSVSIPNTVAGIGSSAFYGCSALTQIDLPGALTTIGSNAFFGCDALTYVRLPNCVTSIGSCAFEDCTVLSRIIMPESVTEIGEHALSGCAEELVCVVKDDSFAHEWCLENHIPFDLLLYRLGDTSEGVLRLQTLLRSLGLYYGEITGNFGRLTERAVENYQKEIGLPQDGIVTQSIMKAILSANGALNAFTLPASLKIIESGAFAGSTANIIVIPEGCTFIGSRAFSGCTELIEITIPGSVTYISADAFSGCSGVTVIAPADSAAQQMAEANGFTWQKLE